MKGRFYAVGVGPGDPELITMKAVRILKECDVIAGPVSRGKTTALDIAASYIEGKEILLLEIPMNRDQKERSQSHKEAALKISSLLEEGKSVSLLTLGDPCIYSSCWYIFQIIQKKGYEAEIISGIPSFCAAAAKMKKALCEDDEMLHIIPASHGQTKEGVALPGNKIFMKSGKAVLEVKKALLESGQLSKASLVERCGMEGERVFEHLEDMEEESGYFSVILVKA